MMLCTPPLHWLAITFLMMSCTSPLHWLAITLRLKLCTPPFHWLAITFLMMLSSAMERIAEVMALRHIGHLSPAPLRACCRHWAQNVWPQPRVVALLNMSRQMGLCSSSERPAAATGPPAPPEVSLWPCVVFGLPKSPVELQRGMAPFLAELVAAAAEGA